jgi:hypothetical protein
MTSQNEDRSPPPTLDLDPAGPPLSLTCERDHGRLESFSAHGYCFGCGGRAWPAVLALLPRPLATFATGESLQVEASGEGAIRLSWRLGGRMGARFAVVLGVPEAHNVSDVLALAAAAKHAAGSEAEAVAAIFGSFPSLESDDDLTIAADDVRAWAAAPCDGARVVLGFVMGKVAFREGLRQGEREACARVLVTNPKDFAARVLRAACVAQSMAQGETYEGPDVDAAPSFGADVARARGALFGGGKA